MKKDVCPDCGNELVLNGYEPEAGFIRFCTVCHKSWSTRSLLARKNKGKRR